MKKIQITPGGIFLTHTVCRHVLAAENTTLIVCNVRCLSNLITISQLDAVANVNFR